MVDGGHVFPMSFVGVYSPLTGPILEGPPAHNCYLKPRISATAKFGARATTRPPDPTLPTRAHLQDDGSAGNSLKLLLLLLLLLLSLLL